MNEDHRGSFGDLARAARHRVMLRDLRRLRLLSRAAKSALASGDTHYAERATAELAAAFDDFKRHHGV